MIRFWLLLSLTSLCARGETLVLLSKCEVSACVVMDLLPSGPKAFEKRKTLKDGSEELVFSVRGKPGKGVDRALTLIFHRPQGQKECHGLGPVAVLGIADDRPILATNAGPLELTDGSLVAGCPNCVRIVDPDSGKTVSEPPSPSRDVVHAGFGFPDFSVDKKGKLWLRLEENKCLLLAREGLFTLGSQDDCKVRESKPLPTPAGSPEPGFARFDLGKFQLWFAEPGC